MATTKIRSSSILDGQVANADLSATVAVTGGQIADDAVTLAKMAGGTDGNLITYDASGDPAYVATGAATNVLTSNGTGAAPTFQAAATATNTPSFGAYRTADFDYTDDTWTKIPMDTEEWDTDSAFDNSAYKFTVPADKAGKYCFSVTTTMTDITSAGQMMGSIKLAIYKGASGGSSSLFKQSDFDGAGARHQFRCLTLTAVLDLIVGDFIEFYGSGESDVANAVSLGGQSYTFCSGFKLL